jgi:hypothetical protein
MVQEWPRISSVIHARLAGEGLRRGFRVEHLELVPLPRGALRERREVELGELRSDRRSSAKKGAKQQAPEYLAYSSRSSSLSLRSARSS